MASGTILAMLTEQEETLLAIDVTGISKQITTIVVRKDEWELVNKKEATWLEQKQAD